MSEATILFLAANPISSGRLSLDEEVRDLQERIQRRSCRINLHLQPHWAVRPGDVQRVLNETQPAVVHFSGHGNGALGLMFHDKDEKPKMINGSTLRDLFRTFRSCVRIVLLNACYSEKQAKEICKEIDCVVGMKKAISDRAAKEFTGAFYQALAYGQDVENAFAQGRVAMKLDGGTELDAPCLLFRSGVVPSRVALGSLPANGRSRSSGPYSRNRDVATPSPLAVVKSARGRTRFVIRLEASLSEMNPDLVKELTDILRRRTGDMLLTIEKVEEGSVILTIVTSDESGGHLIESYESGELRELAGLRVTSVREEVSAEQRVAISAEQRVAVSDSSAQIRKVSHSATAGGVSGGIVLVGAQGGAGAVAVGPSSDREEREHGRWQRVLVDLEVDYGNEENYLFAYIRDISATGIFVRTNSPEPLGTRLNLRFTDEDAMVCFQLEGEVIWIYPDRPSHSDNLHPGMGIRFTQLTDEDRVRLVQFVKTFAYLDDDPE
jgi:uncharacterized protein (TIGR02266 family)